MEEVFDTLYILRVDTATNTEIYYHETVKLMESSNWIAIYVPIFIAVLALGFSLRQFFLQRRDKKIQNTPNVDFIIKRTVENITKNHSFTIYEGILINNGLGSVKINSIQYEVNRRFINNFEPTVENSQIKPIRYNSILELLFKELKNYLHKVVFFIDSEFGYEPIDDLYLNKDSEYSLFVIKFHSKEKDLRAKSKVLSDFDLSKAIIEFESLYDKKPHQLIKSFNRWGEYNKRLKELYKDESFMTTIRPIKNSDKVS